MDANEAQVSWTNANVSEKMPTYLSMTYVQLIDLFQIDQRADLPKTPNEVQMSWTNANVSDKILAFL